MSIGPLAPVATGINTKSAEPGTAASSPRSAQGGPGAANEPDTETVPQQQGADSRNAQEAVAIPQDVVEVHQDSQVKSQLIVEYLDQAHNVILQVPSDEALAVERGIAQELEQAAKLRSSAAVDSAPTKGEPNGD